MMYRYFYTSLALCLLCLIHISSSFTLNQINIFRVRKMLSNERIQNEDVDAFMKGLGNNKPWNGSKAILKRKGQYPQPNLEPKDIIRICLAALQHNDDPQLDHGASVVMEFKSPTGVLAENGLDPSGFGRFLRSSNYSKLLDFKSAVLVGDLENLKSNQSIRQRVRVLDFASTSASGTDFDFYLSKHDELWLIDAILQPI